VWEGGNVAFSCWSSKFSTDDCKPILRWGFQDPSGSQRTARERNADEAGVPGRASREEEDPQGPREEENHIHPPICERYAHRW
jgi:hypothetical protein